MQVAQHPWGDHGTHACYSYISHTVSTLLIPNSNLIQNHTLQTGGSSVADTHSVCAVNVSIYCVNLNRTTSNRLEKDLRGAE